MPEELTINEQKKNMSVSGTVDSGAFSPAAQEDNRSTPAKMRQSVCFMRRYFIACSFPI